MDNQKNESCIVACKASVEACETCSTENKDVAGKEQSVKLCIAAKDACNELLAASKTGVNLDSLYKKCEAACTASAMECEKHTDCKHCKASAEASRKCAAACKAMLTAAA